MLRYLRARKRGRLGVGGDSIDLAHIFPNFLPELVHIYYSDLRDFDLRDKIFARINRVKRGLPVTSQHLLRSEEELNIAWLVLLDSFQ